MRIAARPTVRRLLSDQSRWCQGALARDSYGDDCLANDPAACQWSLVGAICHLARSPREADDLAERLQAVIGPNRLQRFNDTTTHRELKRVLKRARV